MELKDFNNEFSKKIGCWFSKPVKTGEDDRKDTWHRVHVLNSEGCSVGRLTFKNEKLHYVKSYKRDYRTDIDETDLIFFRLERYLEDETVVPLVMHGNLIDVAQSIVDADLEQKIQWRKDNPKYGKGGNRIKRRPLEGKNIRYVLRALVNNIDIANEKFEKSIETLCNDRNWPRGS